ncbi:MAG: serine aminopeptidase domain-containing protein [bacterium]
MAKNGITAIGFDFEGFGKSGGLKGYIHNLDNLINDMLDFTKYIGFKFLNER